MSKLSKFAQKELKGIEKRFNELFGDNDCSGNYICTHETTDKHWTVYEDDLQALKSYISMTVYDIEKNAEQKDELLDALENHKKTLDYIVKGAPRNPTNYEVYLRKAIEVDSKIAKLRSNL